MNLRVSRIRLTRTRRIHVDWIPTIKPIRVERMRVPSEPRLSSPFWNDKLYPSTPRGICCGILNRNLYIVFHRGSSVLAGERGRYESNIGDNGKCQDQNGNRNIVN